MEYPIKRELDSMYYRVKRGEKWESLCVSDLTEEERREWFETMTKPELIRMSLLLAGTLRAIGDELNISFTESDK